MTIESGHSHNSSRIQPHSACYWCTIAHVAAGAESVLLFASMMVAGEQVSPWEGAGKSCFAIFLYWIRPPPRLQAKDLNT
jgi:hypothetical protein